MAYVRYYGRATQKTPVITMAMLSQFVAREGEDKVVALNTSLWNCSIYAQTRTMQG